MTSDIDPMQRDLDHFNEAIKNVLQYLVSNEAKDTLISYMEMGVHKPRDVMPNEHVMHVQEMICVANKLPGSEQNITPQQERKIIFGSFPKA